MDAMEALVSRRSVRSYRPAPVDPEAVRRIVDAGRLAATANNVQPWEFVVITDAAQRQRIADMTDHGKFIADAPVCIVVLSQPAKYYLEDGSAATQNMLVAAAALGLGSCWVAGDKKSYATAMVELCKAPADFKLVALVSIGHPAKVPAPSKRSLNEVLHMGSYQATT